MSKTSAAASTLVPRVRRTQRERSAAMRQRLLEATIDCLYDLGYARTTTIEVAARAGVSRGAQLHHFPTKERLVEIALRHLLMKRLVEFREAVAALPKTANKQSAVIDILWDKLSNRAFYAWLELVVAARTDEALRPAVTELAAQFREQVEATYREFFAANPDAPLAFDVGPAFAFALLQGLALDRFVGQPGDAKLASVLGALKLEASRTLVPKG